MKLSHSLVHENVSVESERPPAKKTSFEEMRLLPVILTAGVVPHSGPHREKNSNSKLIDFGEKWTRAPSVRERSEISERFIVAWIGEEQSTAPQSHRSSVSLLLILNLSLTWCNLFIHVTETIVRCDVEEYINTVIKKAICTWLKSKWRLSRFPWS